MSRWSSDAPGRGNDHTIPAGEKKKQSRKEAGPYYRLQAVHQRAALEECDHSHHLQLFGITAGTNKPRAKPTTTGSNELSAAAGPSRAPLLMLS